MELLENKKLLTGIGVGIAVVAAIVLSSSNSEEASKQNIKTEKVIQNDKNIEILYLEDDKKKVSSTTKKNIAETHRSNTLQKTTSNGKTFDSVSKMDFSKDGSIENYIRDRNLVDLNPKASQKAESNTAPEYSVYASISTEQAKEQRDNSIPPPAPVFFTVTSSSGQQYSGVVDADILSQGEVFITKNAPDGTKEDIVSVTEQQELKSSNETSQEETKMIAPPQVGQ